MEGREKKRPVGYLISSLLMPCGVWVEWGNFYVDGTETVCGRVWGEGEVGAAVREGLIGGSRVVLEVMVGDEQLVLRGRKKLFRS